jgi:GntR family transcriptional regulator
VARFLERCLRRLPRLARHPPPEATATVEDPLISKSVTLASTSGYDANVNSTNPAVEIDHASPVPLHEQVAAAIRRAIAEGEAQAGERLPPAKDLAAVLGVNPNTVFRALRALREEGLVDFRRGRGVSVTGIAPQRSVVIAQARELVAVARRYGYRPDELAEIIDLVS